MKTIFPVAGLLLALAAQAQPQRPPPHASGPWNNDVILVNPSPVAEVLAHELAHVVQQRAGSPHKTKHDTAKNSIGNVR